MKNLIAAASVVLSVAGAGIQSLSPEEITAAIEQGRAGKTLQKQCGSRGENGFDIIVQGPVGRIMQAAREAKRQHQSFTAADVTWAVGGPFLTVVLRRDYGLSAESSAMPLAWVMSEPERLSDYLTAQSFRRGAVYATDVVLRNKPRGSDKPIVFWPVMPLASVGRHSFSSGLRGPSTDRDMTVSFDFAAFKAAPRGDVEVVVFVSDAGERRCKISDKDRQKLR